MRYRLDGAQYFLSVLLASEKLEMMSKLCLPPVLLNFDSSSDYFVGTKILFLLGKGTSELQRTLTNLELILPSMMTIDSGC